MTTVNGQEQAAAAERPAPPQPQPPTAEVWAIIGPRLLEQRRALLEQLAQRDDQIMDLELNLMLRDQRIAELKAKLALAESHMAV